MIKTVRVMLIPNNKQRTKLFQYANTARFAYNWALGREKENYEHGSKFISDRDLRKEFTQLKKGENIEVKIVMVNKENKTETTQKEKSEIDKLLYKKKAEIERSRVPDSAKIKKRLTEEQKKTIKELYATGDYSYAKLARLFSSTPRTISKTINPEYAERVNQKNKEYYANYNISPEKRAEYNRKIKEKKRQLYLDGILKIDK